MAGVVVSPFIAPNVIKTVCLFPACAFPPSFSLISSSEQTYLEVLYRVSLFKRGFAEPLRASWSRNDIKREHLKGFRREQHCLSVKASRKGLYYVVDLMPVCVT